jgi:dihydroflavonol-4-reductase
VRQLAKRGDELKLTRRRRSRWENVDGIDAEVVECDVLDRAAVRRALKGVDRVFHVAGVVSMRPNDVERMFEVNVRGTRTVLEECLRKGVERVVYTSSCAAIGPAKPGGTTDERQLFTAGHLGIPYVNAKHEAEVEAFRVAAAGLPLVVVNPSYAFGRGDVYVRSSALVRRFILRQIPVYVPGALNIVHVDDVARGQLLADERGHVGERYIFGNRNYTWDRLFADLARLSGVEPPALKLSPGAAIRLTQAVEAASLGRAPIMVNEARLASQWWTYSNAKAKRELGWQPSPHEEALEATVEWYREREGDRIKRSRRAQPLQYKVAGAALGAARRLWPLAAA